MTDGKFKNLTRPIYPMPDFIKTALQQQSLMEAYRERPAYQQNDYIGWITRAKRQETVDKRLAQMLEELKNGDKYMKMPYRQKKNKNNNILILVLYTSVIDTRMSTQGE